MSNEIARKVELQQRRFVADLSDTQASNGHAELNADWVARVSDYLEGTADLGNKVDNRIKAIPSRAVSKAAAAIEARDRDTARFNIAHHATQQFLEVDLGLKIAAAGLRPKKVIPHWAAADLALQLNAIGWHDEATDFMTRYWTQYPQTTSAPLDNPDAPLARELLAWFGSYFTLGSRDLIAPYGFKEPNEPDRPMSHLLGRWREADAAGLRNLMTGFAENNCANLLLPRNRRTPDYDNQLMLFFPYDVLAIQTRRETEGLDPVPYDDPRAAMMYAETDRLPFLADDLIWPAYQLGCERLGLEQYVPRETVGARYDRFSFSVEPV